MAKQQLEGKTTQNKAVRQAIEAGKDVSDNGAACVKEHFATALNNQAFSAQEPTEGGRAKGPK